MNYYRRYIGDFLRDTQHLTIAEVGAYDRLLDAQYASERALPVELPALCRICRAETRDEQAAVRAVVAQFFPEAEGGRWNPRAQRELQIGVAAIEKMRAAGQMGARRRWGEPRAADREPDRVGQDVGGGVPDRVAIEPPTTNHQPPATTRQPPAATRASGQGDGVQRVGAARASRLAPEWELPEVWRLWSITTLGWSEQHALAIGDRFHDYWIAKPGKDGKKLDWFATWRNWCRAEQHGKGGNGSATSRQARIEANNAQAAREWLNEGAKK